MKGDMLERCKLIADYVIENHATVREAAKKFEISKSTVHKDLVERLERADPERAKKVAEVLSKNKAEWYIRGGAATKAKYKGMKKH